MTPRQRFLRWLADRIEPWPLRLRLWAAEPYDPEKWPALDISDEEWAAFREAMEHR